MPGVKKIAKTSGPIAWNNCLRVYDMMASKATMRPAKELQEYGYPAEDGEEILVFAGHASKDAEALGLLTSSASHALQLLNGLRATTLLVKGNAYRPSIYILHYKPTEEDFKNFTGREWALDRKIRPTSNDALVNDIVRLREELASALARISALEAKVDDLNNIRGSQALPPLRESRTGNITETTS